MMPPPLLLASIALLAEFLAESSEVTSCAALKNHDIFHTLEVGVGSPPQKFELVADTGSNACIVQSCLCQAISSCPYSFGRCFRGINTSSTFQPPAAVGPEGTLLSAGNIWTLTFGSGDIEAMPASDKVSVGGVSTMMKDSLLLMISQSLDFEDTFEGILGLGIPVQPRKSNKRLNYFEGFFEKADASRFSLCFNANSDGVFGVGPAAQSGALGSISREHWAVGLSGIAVAGRQLSSMKHRMAIPDSGSTLVSGPSEEVKQLLEYICEEWPRCRKAKLGLISVLATRNSTKSRKTSDDNSDFLLRSLRESSTDSFDRLAEAYERHQSSLPFWQPPSSTEMLVGLLMDCESWLNRSVDLDAEMPSIAFKVRGAEGKSTRVVLKPTSYVVSMEAETYEWSRKNLFGFLPYWWPARKNINYCSTQFGEFKYSFANNEKKNAVWIFGSPIFYSYQVHFDSGAKPPSIAFEEKPCGSCVGGQQQDMSLLSEGLPPAPRPLRHLSQPPRLPWPRQMEQL